MDRNNKFFKMEKCPRFLIVSGAAGSGKKFFISQVCKHYNIRPIWFGCKVDDIRTIISESYSLTMPTMYIISDCDDMSIAAKNALLKITEEPNNNVYVAMTLENTNNTLPTILSRGYTYEVDPWKESEIIQVCKEKGKEVNEEILDIATNPGEYEQLETCFEDILDFAYTVCDNIDRVTDGNSLKIANRISFNSTDKGYSMQLFLRVLVKTCYYNILDSEEKIDKQANWIILKTAHEALMKIRGKGINKRNVFDWFVSTAREQLFELG